MEDVSDKKISPDILYSVAIIAFAGLFVLINYFFGFFPELWAITMTISFVLAVCFPRAGLYAIIFLTFIFERFFTLAPIVLGRVEYKLYPVDILIGAVILGTFWQVISGKVMPKFRKIDLALVAFFVLSVLYFFVSTIFLKNDMALAFSTAKNYAFYMLLFFVAYILIHSKDHIRELAGVVFSGAVGILWFIIYGAAAGHGLWSDFTPLSTDGIRTLAFTHAFYLCMALITVFVYMAYNSKGISKYFIVLAPIWAMGVVGSMMRHLWISLFVAFVFLLFMFSQNERKRLKEYTIKYAIFTICLGIVISFGAALFPRSGAYQTLNSGAGMIGTRVVSVADTSGDESIVWRTAVWQQAVKQYSENPIFGIGFGKKIPVEIGKYHDFVEARDVHNSFLVLVIQMGIFGFGLIAFYISKIGWKVFKNKFESQTLQMASFIALGILVLQIVAFMFQPYLEANLLGMFFWINLGILRQLYENI